MSLSRSGFTVWCDLVTVLGRGMRNVSLTVTGSAVSCQSPICSWTAAVIAFLQGLSLFTFASVSQAFVPALWIVLDP